jgi:D-galactarolactone cycloisomerase
MKIIDVIPHVISSELNEPVQFSQGWIKSRNSLIVEIVTEDGNSGWGESMCHGIHPPEIAAAFVQYCYKPLLIDRSLWEIEVLWEEMYNRARPFGQYGAALNALSGVDIALWDAMGRYLKLPVYKLFGAAYRTKVCPYVTSFYRRKGGRYPEDAVTEAELYINRGFRALKLKAGFGVKEDLNYIAFIRKALDPAIQLMVDFNCAYNAGIARRIIFGLKDLAIHFFEELLAPEDIEGYKSIKNLSSTYIAAGENIFGKIGYRKWIAEKALDILQPDLCSAGGFTECKKIAALAQAWNIPIIPHVWGSGISLAASLQYIAMLPPTPLCENPEEPFLEYDQSDHPFRLDLINNAIIFKDGTVAVPEGPGIGVDVNRDVLRRFERKVFL